MVRGLERFRQHFAPYNDQYVLISGMDMFEPGGVVNIAFKTDEELAL